jgi:hypothetical protein
MGEASMAANLLQVRCGTGVCDGTTIRERSRIEGRVRLFDLLPFINEFCPGFDPN